MKLHLTFHNGCANVIKGIFPDIETKLVTSGRNGYFYNMTQYRADTVWENNKDYFNSFDTIIVSDTIPLARILLDRYEGKLILWSTNRFDYGDTKDPAEFPDKEYYKLIRRGRSNVQFITNNYFDAFYALDQGIGVHDIIKAAQPPHPPVDKTSYYVPEYWNEKLFNLAEKCAHLNPVTGRYEDGQLDTFKAVIHIPYTWSSIALYDALAAGVPYYVPTTAFLLKLLHTENFWFQNANYMKKYLGLCEFYRGENSKFVKYFTTFEEIKDIEINHQEIYEEAGKIYEKNLAKWKMLS